MTPLEIHQAQLLTAAGKAGARFEPPPQPTPKPAPGTFVVAVGDNASQMPQYSPWYQTDINPNPNPTQAELDAYYAGPTPGKVPFVPGQTSYGAASTPTTAANVVPINQPTPSPLPASPAASSGQLVGSFKRTNPDGKSVFGPGPGANDQTVKLGMITTQGGTSYTVTAFVEGGEPLGLPLIEWTED